MKKRVFLFSMLLSAVLFLLGMKLRFLSPETSIKVGKFQPSATTSAKKTSIPTNSKQIDGRNLIPFKATVDGVTKFGYRTKFGEVVIPPRFYSAHYFQDGYAEVAINTQETGKYYKHMHQYGFFDGDDLAIINIFGEIVLKGKDNERFHCHSDGLLSKIVLPPEAQPGSHKLAEASEQVIAIKTGRIFPIPPETTSFGCFKENLAATGIGIIPVGETDHRSLKFGYIGKNGKWKIAPTFDDAQDFDNGLALVTKGDQKFFINVEGKKIINGDRKIRTKLELIQDENARFKVVDINGKTVFYLSKSLRRSFDIFTDGLLLVRDEKLSRYGYINSSGKVVIDTRFKEARPFKNGVAEVITVRDQDAYIDTTGKILWEDIKSKKNAP